MEERSTSGGFMSMDTVMPTREAQTTPMNGSFPMCYKKNLILAFLTLIIAMIGVAGNAVVLWILGCCMRRNTFSIYILNLAAADFLFLCFQIIDSLEEVFNFFSFISMPTPRFFMIVSNFAYLAGLSMLSAMSTERCMSVLWPIWYRCHRWRHTSAVVCALLWALSLSLSIPEGKYCGFLIKWYDYEWCQILDFITSAWLMVLFVTLSGSSLTLIVKILCGSQRVPVTRLYVTIGLTVLVFLSFGLPFGMYWFLLFWILSYDVIPCESFWVTVVLSCVNSFANPIIYFFAGSFRQRRWKRGTLKLVLQRAMQDTPDEGDSGSRVSSGNLGE
ncbi:mas-related G-protein coupled receptor member X2-like [Marmota marmota marmota]|uniref:mas-related G-protein coupled receptor member X2-like n=1 Tax=Marmota marmota marmota TaxID=9994 RepID=UPI0020920FA6|nr:mas-related G-protein coupled receptor member X2-like [Marmota marmota marmota]